jgi:hypothetical protein
MISNCLETSPIAAPLHAWNVKCVQFDITGGDYGSKKDKTTLKKAVEAHKILRRRESHFLSSPLAD